MKCPPKVNLMSNLWGTYQNEKPVFFRLFFPSAHPNQTFARPIIPENHPSVSQSVTSSQKQDVTG